MSDDGPTPIGEVLQEQVDRAREAQRRAHEAHPDRIPDPYSGGGDTLDAFQARQEALARGWADMVPEAYGDPTLEDLGADLRRRVDPWAGRPRGALIITGPVGVGKSHLGWAVVRPVYFAGRRVWAGTTSALVAALRPDASKAYHRMFDHLTRADLVLLDDLGAERQTDWSADQVAQVIHARWEHGRPTVVTTNLSPSDLRDHLGERTYSRLTADVTAVRLTGEDRRRTRT